MPYRGVEEAGPHGAIAFHYSGNPRGITRRSGGERKAEVCAEMTHDAMELFRRFGDETATLTRRDQGLDCRLERRYLPVRQSDLVLPLGGPACVAVEGGGLHISCEEGNGIQLEIPRRCGRRLQLGVVGLLNRTTGGHRKP